MWEVPNHNAQNMCNEIEGPYPYYLTLIDTQRKHKENAITKPV